MFKIIFVAPFPGNGGIASWANNYRKNVDDNIELVSVDVSRRRNKQLCVNKIKVVYSGILDMLEAISEIKKAIRSHPDAKILHATTSGGLGTIRDYQVARIARKYGMKTILHCHYGNLPEIMARKNILSRLLKKTFNLYDQIWVLDSKTQKSLIREKVNSDILIAPNFIDVPKEDIEPITDFKHVGFIGNVSETKGVLDLITAVSQMDNGTKLSVIGPFAVGIQDKIQEILRASSNDNIGFLGKMPNELAVKELSKFDIVALPTYFKSEAFPISILEAMSRAKLVISCNRAAIPDMLTDIYGKQCGILVSPKSPEEIKSAILWCQEHVAEARDMCKKAYEKVNLVYKTERVIQLYADFYSKL
jgi:glycosyltransferase involved in cell wall biosynthesis